MNRLCVILGEENKLSGIFGRGNMIRGNTTPQRFKKKYKLLGKPIPPNQVKIKPGAVPSRLFFKIWP